MLKIGINLLWLKPGKMGGVESFVKNLLMGLEKLNNEKADFVIFINSKAYENLKEWDFLEKFKIVKIDVDPFKVWKIVMYQYFNMGRLSKRYKVNLLYHPTPIYPLRKIKDVKQIVTFHDLQFLHYPEYASFLQRIKYYWSWKMSLKNSDKIIAISKFTKNDIISNFKVEEEKIEVIYNPIANLNKFEEFSKLAQKYNIQEKRYFYTVSSMLPHKNTETLLKVIKEIKERNLKLPRKLIISGVKTNENKIIRLIKNMNIENEIILTGFISDSERNTLYANATAFLFPSVFEGFGMPPVEALILGTPVITTKCTSLYEVTKGKAIYVEDPYNVDEWIEKMYLIENNTFTGYEFENLDYNYENISNKYFDIFLSMAQKY